MKTPTVKDIYHDEKKADVSVQAGARLVVALLVIVGLVALFVGLTDEVLEGDTLPFDQQILQWLYGWRNPGLDAFVRYATELGGVIGVTVLTLVASIWLYLRKKYRAISLLLIGVLGAVGINLILKTIFMRERPDLWEHLVLETSYSFPSGHSMASSALAASVALILWQTKWHWWAVGLAASYMVFVGLSRMYLSVHYPTDVIGGWMLSLAWVGTVAVVLGIVRAPNLGSRQKERTT